MNTLVINKNDFKNCQIEIDATNLPNNFKSCQIEIDATHLANILLQCNIDIQREFLNHFLYKLSNKQINQLSTCVGLGQAYDNLETLYKLANAELPKLVAKWEEEEIDNWWDNLSKSDKRAFYCSQYIGEIWEVKI